MVQTMGFFEPISNRVVIDADLSADLQLAILFHEVRHLEQYARGICPDMSLAMREYARAIWALEADATTISLIVAWDLQERGEPGPWQALSSLPHYAETVAGFAEIMEETGDLTAASEAAFALWYDHAERRSDYYIAACSAYLDELDRTHRLPRYNTLDLDFFGDLCILPDGSRFDCLEPRQPSPD